MFKEPEFVDADDDFRVNFNREKQSNKNGTDFGTDNGTDSKSAKTIKKSSLKSYY